jgi:hypothetical protein
MPYVTDSDKIWGAGFITGTTGIFKSIELYKAPSIVPINRD